MAYEYVLLPHAQRDFDDIVQYLAIDLASPQAARHFIDEFVKKMALVCQSPHLYSLSRIPEIANRGYRPMPVMRYVALYSIRGDLIVVAHIFHQSQDYARYV